MRYIREYDKSAKPLKIQLGHAVGQYAKRLADAIFDTAQCIGCDDAGAFLLAA